MGRLKDFWDDVTDWVHDKIVEPIIDWFTDLIEDTRTFIRIWKHEFHKLLAKWLENDLFFLAVIAATVVLAFVWPKIVTWAGKLTIVMVFKEAWKDVEEGWVDVLDFIHIIELDAINTVLKIFWPDWKAMNAQIMDVTSQLAAELGKGTEYLHAYFAVIHGIAIVENSFTGVDPRLAEMQAFEDTSKGLQKIDDKFWSYAENPSLIVSDMIEDFYLPRGNNIRVAQQDVINSARDSRDKIVGINLALHDFEGRLTHFMEMTPEDLREIIDKRLQPIADALADGLYVMDTEVMPKLDGVIDALALREERQQEMNDNILARIDDPYRLLLQAEFMRPEDLIDLEDYIAELEARATERELLELMPGIDAATDTMIEATADMFQEAAPVAQPQRTALSFEMPSVPVAGTLPSWYQGEY